MFGVPPQDIPAVVRRVRRLFDLDADWASMESALNRDTGLAIRLLRQPGLRLPGAWDGFELSVRSLLVSAGAGAPVHEQLAAVVGQCGEVHVGAPNGLGFVFPGPDRLAIEKLESIGLDAQIAQRIRALAVAVRDGGLRFDAGQEREHFVQRLRSATALGEQEAQWIALRALGDPDACPAVGEPAQRAQAWRPWRAYGCLYASALTQPRMAHSHA